MMRGHKYRVWLNQEQEMYGFNAINAIWFHVQYGMAPSDISAMVELRDKSRAYRTDKDADLMQYTGLKDLSGTDIYEDDVLEWNGWQGKVYWDQSFAAWRAENIGSLGGIPNLKIVGNIHEHPELICA
jgi:hypothetical protein